MILRHLLNGRQKAVVIRRTRRRVSRVVIGHGDGDSGHTLSRPRIRQQLLGHAPKVIRVVGFFAAPNHGLGGTGLRGRGVELFGLL